MHTTAGRSACCVSEILTNALPPRLRRSRPGPRQTRVEQLPTAGSGRSRSPTTASACPPEATGRRAATSAAASSALSAASRPSTPSPTSAAGTTVTSTCPAPRRGPPKPDVNGGVADALGPQPDGRPRRQGAEGRHVREPRHRHPDAGVELHPRGHRRDAAVGERHARHGPLPDRGRDRRRPDQRRQADDHRARAAPPTSPRPTRSG